MNQKHPMFPFVISALISGAAMGMLWFYFDFVSGRLERAMLQSAWISRSAPEFVIGNWEATRVYLSWTLIPAIIPPIAFCISIFLGNKSALFSKHFFQTTILSTLFWLLIFFIIIAGINPPLMPFSGQPYLDNQLSVPFVSLFGAHFIVKSIEVNGKRIAHFLTLRKRLVFLVLPSIFLVLIYFLNKILDGHPSGNQALSSFAEKYLRSLNAQIFWSAIIVMTWQLLFGWMLVKSQRAEVFAEKIGTIGTIGKPDKS